MGISLTFVHGYESRCYAGPLRPFINWAVSLIRGDSKINPNFILFKVDSNVIKGLPPELRKKMILVDDVNELLAIIKKLNPDIIMSDDYFPRLKLLKKIKESLQVKTIVYVQFLYGVHAISNCFYYDQIPLKERIVYKLSSSIPYKLLTSRYVKTLEVHDFFISNSKISKNFFYWLYRIPVEDVIYPPIDTEVFKPLSSNAETDSILVYLGSSGDDINLNFLHKIIKTIIEKGLKVHLFGNERVGKILKKTYGKNVEFHKDLTDAELVKIYSGSLATICPQTWELFGYTAIESMACGTPVLAFNYFGHSETIIHGKTGLLVNTENEFINNLKLLLNNHIVFDRNYIRNYVVNKFSAKKSTNKLIKTIERVYTHGGKYKS